MRRKLLCTLLTLGALAGAVSLPLLQADEPKSTMGGDGPIKGELNDATKAAARKGLDFLARSQTARGEFGDASGGGDNLGIAAIAGLALLADGNLPNQGRYGTQVDRLLDYILRNCQPSGLIAGQNYGSPMYGHGFATLFLAECFGHSDRPDLKEKLQNAIRLIVQTQNREGGWRYQPAPVDADTSVTICEVMALRAARNAGIKVPKVTIDKAIEYVKKAQQPDGGFAYTLGSDGSGFPRSAASVASLFYSGLYDGKEITNGMNYLRDRMPGMKNKPRDGWESHYYYGHYYATQAFFMAGGNDWAKFWPAMRDEILAKQSKDGRWSGESGDIYATGMALIILQVPNRYLPILQR